jgi:hypothetical protein
MKADRIWFITHNKPYGDKGPRFIKLPQTRLNETKIQCFARTDFIYRAEISIFVDTSVIFSIFTLLILLNSPNVEIDSGSKGNAESVDVEV